MRKIVFIIAVLVAFPAFAINPKYKQDNQDCTALVQQAGVTALWEDETGQWQGRENLLLQSQGFEQSGTWSQLNVASVTNGGAADPDGGTAADKLIPNATSGAHRLLQTWSGVASTGYEYAANLKADGYDYAQMEHNWTSGGAYFNVDLTSCTAGSRLTWGSAPTSTSAPSCVSRGSGWCRCSLAESFGAATGLNVTIKSCAAADCASFSGNGTSGALLYGAQIRRVSQLPTYTPTTTTAIYGLSTARGVGSWYPRLSLPYLQTAPYARYRGDLGTTVDASNRISSWADQTAGARAVAQATDGYKPVLSGTRGENLFVQSDEFDDTWTVTSATIDDQAETAPDGTLTADSITDNADVHTHGVRQSVTLPETAIYRFSVYAKAGTRDKVGLSNSSSSVRCDLTNGTYIEDVAGEGSIESLGGGWYRCSIQRASTFAAGARNFDVRHDTSNYSGTGQNIYVWRAELCRVSVERELPYGTRTTTALNLASPGNNLPAPYFDGVDDNLSNANDLIGTGDVTVAVAFKALSTGGGGAGSLIHNSKFHLRMDGVNYRVKVSSDNVTVAGGAANSAPLNTPTVVVATRSSAGVVNIYMNGVLSGTANQSSGTPAAGSPTYIGNRADRALGFHGYISEPVIIPAILNSTDIATLTAYLSRGQSGDANRSIIWGQPQMVQSTAANQATRSGGDQRENLKNRSEAINQTDGWAAGRATAISATELREDSTAGNTHYLNNAAGDARTVVSGHVYYSAASMKRGTGTRNGRLRLNWPGGTETNAYVDLSNCTVAGTGGSTTAWASGPIAALDSADNTYCRVSGTVAAPATGAMANGTYIGMTDGTNNSAYNGDGASTIHITRVVFRSNSSSPTYIATTTAPIYRGQNGRAGVYFDGSNDAMSSPADLIGTGDVTVVSVFRADSWGGGSFGRIVDNGKFYFYLVNAGGEQAFGVVSDGVTLAKSPNGAIVPGATYVATVTRTSAGVTNIYLNGRLSGTANQSSGTPAAGGATYIGNRAALDRGFHGSLYVPAAIIPRIATQSEISRISRCYCRKYGANCQ